MSQATWQSTFFTYRVKEADQAGDIIWENQWNSEKSIRDRKLCYFFSITSLSFVLYTAVYYLTKKQFEYRRMIATRDCSLIREMPEAPD